MLVVMSFAVFPLFSMFYFCVISKQLIVSISNFWNRSKYIAEREEEMFFKARDGVFLSGCQSVGSQVRCSQAPPFFPIFPAFLCGGAVGIPGTPLHPPSGPI